MRRLLWVASKECNHHCWGLSPTTLSSSGRNSKRKTWKQHQVIFTKATTLEYGWEVIPRPPYSPDLAPLSLFIEQLSRNSQSAIVNNLGENNLYFVSLLVHLFWSFKKNFSFERDASNLLIKPILWQWRDIWRYIFIIVASLVWFGSRHAYYFDPSPGTPMPSRA